VNAILHAGGKEIATPLGEGRDEKSSGLDVGDGVRSGVALWKERACLAGGEAGRRKSE
jgi:hypothetical protein